MSQPSPVRVLVVDDSAFMRQALSTMLRRDPEIEVVGTARDGLEALERVAELEPDVVTLDIEMPRMDGLTALRRIMAEHPRPVVMVSSLTREGAQVTVEALGAGAVDFVTKDKPISLQIGAQEHEILNKVKAAATARLLGVRRRPSRRAAPAPSAPAPAAPTAPAEPAASKSPVSAFRSAFTAYRERRTPEAPAPPPAAVPAPAPAGDVRLLVIGVSTGGPFALQQLIPALPADFPVPIAIVQHMPPHFTRSLAERLDAASALRVVEAEDGAALEAGTVMIAKGGEHLRLRAAARGYVAQLSETPAELLHRPSVDVLFHSIAANCGRHTLALVMTGMGRDGLEGARAIREHGGRVIAQDEETCVVYGMPRAVVEAGVAERSYALEALAGALVEGVGLRRALAS